MNQSMTKSDEPMLLHNIPNSSPNAQCSEMKIILPFYFKHSKTNTNLFFSVYYFFFFFYFNTRIVNNQWIKQLVDVKLSGSMKSLEFSKCLFSFCC